MDSMLKYKKIFTMLQAGFLIVLWSAALFETGVDYFRSLIGLTSSMLSALSLSGLIGIEFIVNKRLELEFGWLSHIKKALLIFILMYLALSFSGVAWSPLPQAAFQKSLRIAWYFLLTIISILVMQKFHPKNAIKILGFSGVVSIFVMLLFIFSSANMTSWLANSISIFADYNVFFMHLVVSSLLMIALLNRLLLKKKIFVYISFFGIYGILTFCLLFSGSRRGIIFYGTPIAIFMALSILKNKKIFIPLITLLVLAVVGLYFFLPSLHSAYNFTTIQRILISIQQEGIYGLVGNRVARIEQAIEYINGFSFSQVLFGMGTKAYTVLFGQGDHPHNFYFNAFIEGGLLKSSLAVLLYFTFIIFGFAAARGKLLFEKVLIMSGLAMYLMTISISGEDGFLLKLFWLLFLYFWFACNDRTEFDEE